MVETMISTDVNSLNGAEKMDTLSIRTSKRKGSEWEILGNLEKGVHYTIKPKRLTFYSLGSK